MTLILINVLSKSFKNIITLVVKTLHNNLYSFLIHPIENVMKQNNKIFFKTDCQTKLKMYNYFLYQNKPVWLVFKFNLYIFIVNYLSINQSMTTNDK